MQSSPRVRADRGAAMLVALAINGWAVWALTQAMRPGAGAAADTVVLQAVWLPRHAPDQPASIAAAPRPVTPRPTRRPPQLPTPPRAGAPHTTALDEAPADAMATRPISAVYLTQIRRAADDELGAAIASRDPLADRVTRLPGQAVNRFRMREPMSAARAVAMVGQLFGGNDPAEPCRSNRSEIAVLGTQGDSKRLQQELDYERRWCRP